MEPEKKATELNEAASAQAPVQESLWQKYKKRQEIKKEKERQKTTKQKIMSWVWTIVAALVMAFVLRIFVVELIRVDGTSMTNTLQDGEIVLVNKWAYWTGEPQRNDIVICRYPNRIDSTIPLGASMAIDFHTLFVKRLVALPGDTVQIHSGKLYVNGELVPDPEYMGSVPMDYGPVTLKAGQYFVMGDNRYSSHDSRASDVGPISRDAIMGKVNHVLFPWANHRGVE